jgi:hypothetical protein
VKVVMVIDSKTGGVGEVGSSGALIGDNFYVDVDTGFENISQKTLAMMALVDHIDFRFLAKADVDTFPCLRRIAEVRLKKLS